MTKALILGIDLFFAFAAFSLALFIESHFEWEIWKHYMWDFGPWVLLAFRLMGYILLRTYLIIIRFVGRQDIKNFTFAVTGSSLGFLGVLYFNQTWLPPSQLVSIVVLDYLLLMFAGLSFRTILRILYQQLRKRNQKSKLNTIIFGAGEMGGTLERVLTQNMNHPYNVVAFFDDNPKVHNKYLNGIKIFNPGKIFDPILRKYDVKVAIIAINQLPEERRIAFINRCLEHGIKVLKVPPTEDWLENKMNVGQLQDIRFEDLLSRPAIQLNKEGIAKELKGKTILVTGAAGSIGSEIVRQIIPFEPHQILGLDVAETPIVELDREMNRKGATCFQPLVADVRDLKKMTALFELYHPDVVFHAAAYKHVPIMESFPEEAIKVNVCGTMQLASLSAKYGVDKFVMVSTDKAVNPTNIMGATKRVAEVFVQALHAKGDHHTQFITTRFGNVLGSNGSVIPIFKRQIAKKESLTVTHPDIERYFMTIPEACQLVLEAGTIGQGGEIFVFDMGQPVKIADLAKKLIQLSGLKLGEDIDIQYTGLRPGEKLFEELLDDRESLMETHHPKILKAKVRTVAFEEAKAMIEDLMKKAYTHQPVEVLREAIRTLVPEYRISASNGAPSNSPPERFIQPSPEMKQETSDEIARRSDMKDWFKKTFLRTVGQVVPSDLFSKRFPVSVKGLIIQKGKTLLVKNERGEWDLPGGKLKAGDDPKSGLVREVKEETGLEIQVGELKDVRKLRILDQTDVLVVVYHCRLLDQPSEIILSGENFDGKWMDAQEMRTSGYYSEYLNLVN